ncbi:hypothetical protein [Rhodopseudomonas palustris]|uniref:hypothetical protein n=1 Tax=Rhodopseudomonas palustris TaxID=1076 RepID=UPI0005AAD02B|nr:hypothetical protein [Rhodopseudomonas palustris]OPF91802.1 hypothetical protein B1S06_20430 [Rhodopseudomonas palustris]RJF60037.1 hypothetical protein D4Q71_20965 [Rhodopseudomonas palustris]WAB78586.1 hypothetical protein OR798_04630 [Rhodopseudomonas palustris]
MPGHSAVVRNIAAPPVFAPVRKTAADYRHIQPVTSRISTVSADSVSPHGTTEIQASWVTQAGGATTTTGAAPTPSAQQ